MESIDLKICELNFQRIIDISINEKWSRDPFDRIIVANAKKKKLKLLTKDKIIRKNYKEAIW